MLLDLKNRIIHNKSLLYAVISVLIEVMLISIFFDISFMTNDDSGLQAAFNGTYTGRPYPYHQFINVFLGKFICMLYTLFPQIQWWFVWSMFCMCSGILLIHYTIFKITSNFLISITEILFLAFYFEIYCLTNINFTIVPVIFSLGAITLFFIPRGEYKWNWMLVAIVSFVLIVSSMHRYLSALIMFCFFGVGLLYYSLKESQSLLAKNVLRFLFVAIITIGLMFGVNKASSDIQVSLNGDYFTELNEYRGMLTDFPHPSYEEQPEVYEKHGWDENTYKLFARWCFLFDEYDLDSLKGIVTDLELTGVALENEGANFKNLEMELENIENELRTFWDLRRTLDYFNIVKVIVVASVIGLSFIGIISIIIKKDRINWLFMFFALCGGLIIISYLVIIGRPILRAVLSAVIPMIVICLILFNKEYNIFFEKIDAHKLDKLMWGILLGVVITTSVWGYSLIYNTRSDNNEVCERYLEYGNLHPDNIYIYTDPSITSIEIDLFLPHNMIFWGGSAVYSHFYYEQIHSLGLEELNLYTLNNDNVYVVSNVNAGSEKLLQTQLANQGIEVNVELVDMLDDFTGVYKFHW